MVFPHDQPSRKKLSKIGYRDKKGNSYADNQTAVAATGKDLGSTANDTESSNPVTQPPAKIPWADNNWADNYQVQRALNYRDKNIFKKNENVFVTLGPPYRYFTYWRHEKVPWT